MELLPTTGDSMAPTRRSRSGPFLEKDRVSYTVHLTVRQFFLDNTVAFQRTFVVIW